MENGIPAWRSEVGDWPGNLRAWQGARNSDRARVKTPCKGICVDFLRSLLKGCHGLYIRSFDHGSCLGDTRVLLQRLNLPLLQHVRRQVLNHCSEEDRLRVCCGTALTFACLAAMRDCKASGMPTC